MNAVRRNGASVSVSRRFGLGSSVPGSGLDSALTVAEHITDRSALNLKIIGETSLYVRRIHPQTGVAAMSSVMISSPSQGRA
jgi:hypothetical protein